jgi:hypothetical protein
VAEDGTSGQTTAEQPVEAVTPEEIEQLLREDLASVKEKVKNKKPLTEAEIKRLQAHAASIETPKGDDPLEPVWAKNMVELASLLGCSRKQISRYLKLEGEDAAPAPAADGRYNVTLWKLWAQEHGYLRKKLSTAADRQLLEDRGIQLSNERKEIDNAVRRGELMSVDEVCRVITEMVGGVVDGARGMKHSLSPRVVGLTVPEATKRIGVEVDEQLQKLSLGEWAKKKIFWSKISAHLSDLHKRFNLGGGQSVTS